MQEHSFRIRKAAELSGVTEDLIRAWERRYGVLKPRRTPGGYRVYSDADIAVLKRLKRLTEEGVSIAEAARMVPTLRKEVEEGGLGMTGPSAASMPVEAWRQQILEAAASYDQRKVDAVLDQAFASLPTMTVVDALLMPLLREVGQHWCEGKLSIAQEHLITQTVRSRLVSLLHGAPSGSRKHVLCACFPDEQHECGLLAAALRFKHAGMRVTFLGQRTPAQDLAEAIRRIKPDLVALSCSVECTPDQVKAVLGAAKEAAPDGCQMVLGGSGAPLHVDLCRDLGVRPYVEDADWERLLA